MKILYTTKRRYTIHATRGGFTIMEMLVALSIFMIFIALSAGSYIGLMRSNRLASETQRVYRDVRHIFDSIADEVRNSQIDYTCFDKFSVNPDIACIENTQNDTPQVIAFISKDATNTYRTLYKFTDKKVQQMTQVRSADDTTWDTRSDWQSLTSNDTKFDEVSFRAFPLKNPYDADNVGDLNVQFQPSVRLTVKRGDIVYRTTYSSRSYGTKSLYKLKPQNFLPGVLNPTDMRLNTTLF